MSYKPASWLTCPPHSRLFAHRYSLLLALILDGIRRAVRCELVGERDAIVLGFFEGSEEGAALGLVWSGRVWSGIMKVPQQPDWTVHEAKERRPCAARISKGMTHGIFPSFGLCNDTLLGFCNASIQVGELVLGFLEGCLFLDISLSAVPSLA